MEKFRGGLEFNMTENIMANRWEKDPEVTYQVVRDYLIEESERKKHAKEQILKRKAYGLQSKIAEIQKKYENEYHWLERYIPLRPGNQFCQSLWSRFTQTGYTLTPNQLESLHRLMDKYPLDELKDLQERGFKDKQKIGLLSELKLNRYDRRFLMSMIQAVENWGALTEKQRDSIDKMTQKYRKQKKQRLIDRTVRALR